MVAQKNGMSASSPLDNLQLAERLEEVATRLEEQGANPFRVRAYRTGAETIRHLDTPVHEILLKYGVERLTQLPGIGESLARAMEQLADRGRLGLLERLREASDPERLLETVGGIGPEFAKRIHERLGIATLADLEMAALDGRLAELPGMGPKRLRTVRESLSGRFRGRPETPSPSPAPIAKDEPPVEDLLDIDQEYRAKAKGNQLLRIAPRRFNPMRDAWLPVLHTERGGRRYTALFSNTARAHEMGAIRDWVVIHRDGGQGRWTVVTSRVGRLAGRRIVRGREAECARHYQTDSNAPGT